MRPYGPTELRPMTILIETSVFGFLLDQRMSDAGYFASDGNPSLAFEIGVIGIFLDVTRILVAKTVFPLSDGVNCGQPIGIAQTGIAAF